MKQFMLAADKYLYRVLKSLVIFCMSALLIILICNVFFRFVPILSVFPSFSMGWFDEIVEMLFAWMVFSTASILMRAKEHFRVDIIQTKLGDSRWCAALETFIDLCSIVFIAVFTYYSWKLTAGGVQTSPVLRLQKKWFYLCMPVNFSIMLIYGIRNLIVNVTKLFRGKDLPASS